MITIPISKTIQGGTGTLTYLVRIKDDPECYTGCAIINNASGTVPESGIINFEIVFANQSCYNLGCGFEIVVTDSQDCQIIEDLTVPDVCDGFSVSIVTVSLDEYYAVPSGGSPNYTYWWSYEEFGAEPDEGFDINDPNSYLVAQVFYSANFLASPNITLPWVPGTFAPYGGILSVTAKDSFGCLTKTSMLLTPCATEALDNNVLVRVPCLPSHGQTGFIIRAIPCLDKTIDWDTWEVVSFKDPSGNNYNPADIGINITHLPNFNPQYPDPKTIWMTTNNNILVPGLYTLTWRVKDNTGQWSSTATVELHFSECPGDGFADPQSPTIDDCGCSSSCEEINDSGEIRIPVTQCILSECGCVANEELSRRLTSGRSDDCINSASIEIIGGPYQEDASAYYDPYTNELVYIPAEDFEGVDMILWTAELLSGQSLGILTWQINLNCWDDPIGDPDLACGECCETITINVLDNDTPGSPLGWDFNTLEILDIPQHGVAVPNAVDGTIEYTAFCNYAGLDTFSYIVADKGTGKYTEAIEVTVEISCAGIEQEAVFCNMEDYPVASIETELLTSGQYKWIFGAKLNNGVALDNLDELDVEVYDDTNDVLLASATLLVGSDTHTPKIGTDNNWTTLIVPYLENVTLSAGLLSSNAGLPILFDKKTFALTEGYSNTYDSDGEIVGSDVAIDMIVSLVARDMTVPEDSVEVQDFMYRVKVTVLEDTSYVDQGSNPDGNAASEWDWYGSPGTDSTFTTSVNDLHPTELCKTWFSHLSNPLNLPPGRIEYYSLSTNPSTELPTNISSDYLSEGDFVIHLNDLMRDLGYAFFLMRKNYRHLETDFNLLGNNASFFIAYQEESEPTLNSIRVRYKNGGSPNLNKVSRAVIKNFIIF